MKVQFYIGLILWLSSGTCSMGETLGKVFSSSSLLQDVVARSEEKHAYDWRRASFELQLGYGYVDEANNFENDIVDLGMGFPTSGGNAFLLNIRRVTVYSTKSSRLIGRTPFKQDAGLSRYEIGPTFAWGLLEGKSISALTPWIVDLDHVVHLLIGAHYSHPNKSVIPQVKDEPESMAGQSKKNSTYVLNLGARWVIYLPMSFGVYTEARYQIPLRDMGDVGSWPYFHLGVLWSFGAE